MRLFESSIFRIAMKIINYGKGKVVYLKKSMSVTHFPLASAFIQYCNILSDNSQSYTIVSILPLEKYI